MELLEQMEDMGRRAKEASYLLGRLGTEEKNQGLLAAADGLLAHTESILAANALDMENGRKRGMHQGLLDRLALNEARIEAMAEGLRQIVTLEDPIGEVLSMKKRPNGLLIGEKRVPRGVIGLS